MTKVYRKPGEPIVAVVGERFVLELEGNATTGYQWQLELDTDKVRLVDEEYQPSGAGVGGGGLHKFTLEPVAAGETIIHARYKRSWESKPIEEEKIPLRIK